MQKNTALQKNNRYAEKLDPWTYNTKQQQKHPKQITEQLPASDILCSTVRFRILVQVWVQDLAIFEKVGCGGVRRLKNY